MPLMQEIGVIGAPPLFAPVIRYVLFRVILSLGLVFEAQIRYGADIACGGSLKRKESWWGEKRDGGSLFSWNLCSAQDKIGKLLPIGSFV